MIGTSYSRRFPRYNRSIKLCLIVNLVVVCILTFNSKCRSAYDTISRCFKSITHKSITHTAYYKRAAILVFFSLIANWPFWPRSRLNILLNFTFESETNRDNFLRNKRILKWRPFWNKVYKSLSHKSRFGWNAAHWFSVLGSLTTT